MDGYIKEQNILLYTTSSFGDAQKGGNYLKELKEKEINDEKQTMERPIFFKSLFRALVLSLFYLLLQNISSSKTNENLLFYSNIRNSRILYNDILSFAKWSKVHDIEGIKGKNIPSREVNNIHSDMVNNNKKESKNMFVSNKSQETYKKNEMLFTCKDSNGCGEISDYELNEKINNLKGPVDSKTMYLVWDYVSNHEKKKYVLMQEEMLNYCKLLAKHYNIPDKLEKEKWQYVNNKMTKALLKKERFDLKNIKEFAKEELCARWEFQRYINLKRRSWNELREHTKEKWANQLNNWFKTYREKN
ncbi:Plasmodium exported protein (PHIST), unknown function [Plasmodium ovale]|uniref:Plasmodium RESA N-terminal domain-containing protein n=1 Tax=Plasmodium ovale TaxID=36330 RepID=A0A1C3KQ54_PLAOA|nr:Plasmodium exported protein (PHIST), unknown function [Plasmodium ovale]